MVVLPQRALGVGQEDGEGGFVGEEAGVELAGDGRVEGDGEIFEGCLNDWQSKVFRHSNHRSIEGAWCRYGNGGEEGGDE